MFLHGSRLLSKVPTISLSSVEATEYPKEDVLSTFPFRYVEIHATVRFDLTLEGDTLARNGQMGTACCLWAPSIADREKDDCCKRIRRA